MQQTAAYKIWQTVLGQLQLQVTRPNYETWLKNTVGLSLRNGELVVGTPNDYVTAWLSSKMLPLIAKTASRIHGNPLQISFQLHQPQGNGKGLSSETLFTTTSANPISSSSKTSAQIHLNNKYTFDRFVVGDNSRLAYTSALAIATMSGRTYNPLFICGPTGLGKTHLLHALGHRLAAQNCPFLYVTSEQFTNDFVATLKQGQADQFRQRYRHPKALLIDDIQFLADKEHTQEEFFYTFNALDTNGSHIVIAADSLPEYIPSLTTRLRSRLQGGLVADIQPPDSKTRLAILHAKAQELQITLPDEIAALLCNRIPDNIRNLEGCLHRIIAYAQMIKAPSITLELATHALSIFPVSHNNPPSAQDILNAVAQFFNLDPATITGPSRHRTFSHARHLAMYLLRHEAHLQLKEIGYLFNNRDHSTVIHALRKISQLTQGDPATTQQIIKIKQLIHSSATFI